ncbi:beta-ketoacyl synthase chain length factor [Solilutibacter silvestris]|uniref:Beta-ketoacyl synthase, N-terminal domain n=1 Tax=Solilutibacter silvestris TaxID=1645665 RepID=A0A2K1Q0K8_9GAMM|nr:beta-ketoacyl synthase chain length factor [Lysobacter silvestris]PNS08575.1 Beta-ketoacyl synthase, N-terminal domain [Lysobacter silvestris]
MSPLTATIEGIGFWTRGIPDWAAAQRFVATGELPADAPSKPSPRLLPANERRRAPESVAVALEVAQAACSDAGRDPRTLPSIFVSTDGDLPITDTICATLRDAPDALSPTKFHNSVHNAAAGYWTIGQGCMAPSTALSAFSHTFAQGLLEALVNIACGESAAPGQAILLAAYDTGATGPLASVSTGTGLLGGGLVLSAGGNPGPQLSVTLVDGEGDANDGPLARYAAGNRMTPMLPLFDLLATGNDGDVLLDAGAGRALCLEIRHG